MVEHLPATSVTMKRFLLVINILIVAIGNCGGPILMRLYFLHGGKRTWFSSWQQTAGWPILLIPLCVKYVRRRPSPTTPATLAKPVLIDWRTFLSAAGVGLLTGLVNYMFSIGMARLPVSTSSLILATQLAFTAAFAFFLVRLRFTAASINAVVLLTMGAVVLGIHSGGDKPAGESSGQYLLGFFLTLAAAAIYGGLLPVVELMYSKVKAGLTYTVVMEIQLVLSFFGTVLATVGMLINHDFQALGREAMAYGLGETKYYLVVISCTIVWQLYFLGVIGVIFYSSSLLSSIIITVLLPVTEILAVIFFHEKFQAEKGVALFLSLWGFLSYFYGENQKQKKNNINKNDGNSNDDDDNNNNRSENHQTTGETHLALKVEDPEMYLGPKV